MSINTESLSKEPSAIQQRRQANMFLVRLQWLVILLLIAALLWLYMSQLRFERKVNERLQSNEQVVSRLNEMDDRIFAMSQQTLPTPRTVASSQAQNQLDLLRIQIQAADRLLADNNESAAMELLRGLHWQLSQSSNEIAPALTVVIKQSLVKDIERLQARSSQPSPWQLQNIAIQNIQEFLHSYERERPTNATDSTKIPDNNVSLTRRQLMIHEVIMTLNLASQASNMREQEQLVSYLRQARQQLKTLAPQTSQSKTSTNKTSQAANSTNSNNGKVQTKSSPNDITEVIDWLDRLIANAPKPTPLLTTQILDKPKR
ncbi:hypothetical protein [Psychrobacter sp. ANT_WB68]|uniref:hypothetical protein n=1 Tax=Psychrobacter sp. ANT_WB68 TaxID=2597355 RepID=UPI0011F11D04|nr:hypothetical protein [Psychrobacter sp. ANT_WB68]KAA0913491.1 hypothetical protein FQ084_09315 [Psychrobacter sp. ANT_WB68]